MNALIVDDSPMARRIIKHHLTKLGYKVVAEADSAAQAVKMFDLHKPDLVTLDVMMPAIEGIDAMHAFEHFRRESPSAAILIVSALPFAKVRGDFLERGAVGYIVKPFTQFSFEPIRRKLLRTLRDTPGTVQ